MSTREQVSLYFAQGGSDKVYHAQLVEEGDDAYVINVQYGRRGSTLQNITKTASPVDYKRAKKIYDKLVSEKENKGYTAGKEGTPFQGTDKAGRVSGYLPQLLNPATDAEAQALILDDNYVAQEKMNGERRLLHRKPDADVLGINRKGLLVALPRPIADAATKSVLREFVLDGEAVGDVLHVFDTLEDNGFDISAMPYIERYAHASSTVATISDDAIRIVPLAVTTVEKATLYKRVKEEGGEGVVFKDKHAPYTADRPASGGAQRKFKFVETASCIVKGTTEGKRSVSLSLLDAAGRTVDVGNVTIPPNFDIPKAGTIVEVRYLYANPNGGSLYQPVYLGPRSDIEREACKVSQLKFASS
jgi:bifunctional non-homologous end joining protein LigD